MLKKGICSLLALVMLLCLPLTAQAEEAQAQGEKYTIRTAEEFMEFAESCRIDSFSFGLTVSLEADIDLGGREFSGVPIFCGTFLGNGHTIRGLVLKGEGSSQGLFRYLTDSARVEALDIVGLVSPEGSGGKVGALAGNNAGRIIGCSFSGTVSGSENIGGLVGVNSVTGLIEDCQVTGYVSGSHFVGGIAGKNSGVIRSCVSHALVNTTVRQNSVSLSDITLDSLTNSEASNTVTDIGGIAGNSTGVIRGCVNRGDVGYRQMGYNIGGIAGTQSGYITGCANYAPVMGRKEVGGIVGQMEPTTKIEYKEDTLQILEKQLNGMSSLVSTTSGNIQGGAQGLYVYMDALQGSIFEAGEALFALLPSDPEGLFDEDLAYAAENVISNSIADMTHTLQGLSAVTQTMVGTLSNNLHAFESQINAMRNTLSNASETLGGTMADISDEDTQEDLTGKVADCANYGDIRADLNAGGITGAMAVENDLNHEEAITVTGSNSLNFSCELRCVVRDCTNEAAVTVGKQNAGGIVGWQSLGLVKDSYSTGTLDAAGAEYVGGVAGQSEGYIRHSGAKCLISGSIHVGGIAGSAAIATDCISMVRISDATEWVGAILGSQKDGYQEEENPVLGNSYLRVELDLGAIDGISYHTLAEPKTREEFLALPHLPELFRAVELRFRYENGGESRFRLTPGEAFPEEKIPKLPQKEGYVAQWKGLEEADLSCVLYDLTFEAEYSAYDAVLASSDGTGGKPLLLIQGGFVSGAELEIADWTEPVPLEDGQTLLKAKSFTVTNARELSTLRLCIYDWEPEQQRLLIRGSDGTWRQPQTHLDGSYLVAALEEGDNAVAQIQLEATPWLLYGAAAAGLLASAALGYRYWKKRKR